MPSPLAGRQPAAVVRDRERDARRSPRQLDPDIAAAVLERVLEELAEDERERRCAVAGERHRLEVRLDVLPDDEALHEHRPQPLDQLGEVDVVLAVLGQHLVDGGDREDPVDRVGQRPARVDLRRARLQPQQRGDGLEVVLDPVVDLLGEHAAHHRAPVLERDGSVVRDRLEQGAVVVGEGVSRSQTSSPICRRFQRSGSADGVGARRGPRATRSCRPRARARRRSRRHRGDRRLHDRLERLLQVERLGDGLRDLRERLELVHPPLRVGVELRVLDRLRDLGGDRDAAGRSRPRCSSRAARVRTFSAPSSFSRARIGTARIDSYSSSGRFGNA